MIKNLIKATMPSSSLLGQGHFVTGVYEISALMQIVQGTIERNRRSLKECKVWRTRKYSLWRKFVPYEVIFRPLTIMQTPPYPPLLITKPYVKWHVELRSILAFLRERRRFICFDNCVGYDIDEVDKIKSWLRTNSKAAAWLILAPPNHATKKSRVLFARKEDATLFKMFFSE